MTLELKSLNVFQILIFSYLISISITQDLSEKDFLTDELQSAALQIISLHSRSSSDHYFNDELIEEQISDGKNGSESRSRRSVPSVFNIPVLDNSSNFMHSYVSDTGVGNREDLIIDKIGEERLQVMVPSQMRGWRYIRFNSTDFLMAYQDFHINVWRMKLNGDLKDRGLNIDGRNSYCSVDLRGQGLLMDAKLYTKLSKYREVLFFAITLETRKGYELREYKVTSGECISRFAANFNRKRPLRFGFVKSQYESALITLFDSNIGEPVIKTTHKSAEDSTKLIEVYAKSARSLQIFTVNGFTYFTVGHGLGVGIYRLNELLSSHYLVELIAIPDVIDVKAFRLGFNHFLGVATNTNQQYVYIWAENRFHLKQILEVKAVLKWNTIFMATCRDDVLIYFVRNNLPLQIYQWSGQQREFRLAHQEIAQQLSANYQIQPMSSAHFSYNHTAYILQLDIRGRSHLLAIHTRLEAVPDPELMTGHKITESMYNLKERFVFQQTYLQKLSDALKYAIRPNGNKFIMTSHLIRNLTSFGGITASRVKSLSQVFWQNSPLSMNDLKIKFNILLGLIKGLEQQIMVILRTTGDVVLKNRPALITGHKRFIGHNRIGFLNSSNSLIGSIARQDLRQVMTNLYRRRRPQPVRGVKHIFNNLFVNGGITSALINGIEFNKQVVTKNTPQMIKSRIHYGSQISIVNHLVLKGKLNGLDVDKDLVFLTVPQLVTAPKIFVAPIVTQVVNCHTIDGIDLRLLSQSVLTSNGEQRIAGNLHFMKALIAQHITVRGTVNDIDISAMASQLVYKNRPVWIRGKKNFILDDIHIRGSLFVAKHIDGINLPNGVLLRNRDQTITGTKVFNGITSFEGRVIVKGFLDRLRLPQDIVTLTGNETIGGLIHFDRGIVANRDIDARHLVDGVDLSELQLRSLKLNDRVIPSDAHFRQHVTVGSIQVLGTVNGINLKDLLANVIWKNDTNVQISGEKLFEHSLTANQILAQDVNYINLNNLVSTHKNETIDVPKVFGGFTQFNGLVVNGLVSRVNITNLYMNRISLSKPEVILGVKNFVDHIWVDNGLIVTKINGLSPRNDFVLKSLEQTINGHKIFLRPVYANKVITNNPVRVEGHVDHVNLIALNQKIIRLNEHRSYPLNVMIFRSNSSSVQVFKQINGLDIIQFANNVMSLTRPQRVVAGKYFRSGQTFSLVETLKGISGISLSAMKTNAVHLNGHSQVTAHFTFSHPVVFEKPLVVQAMVNGINLTYLATDAVYKAGAKLIMGHNVFRSGLHVNGNIHAFTFNGIDLAKELLTNTRNHIIRGKVQFTKILLVNGDIELNGLINGLDLSELAKRVMRTNDRNIVEGNLELIGPTRVLTNLNIAGHFNGINLTHLFTEAVFLPANQHILGSKILLNGLTLLGNLNTTNMNNIRVDQIVKDMVFINSAYEQHLLSQKVFANDVISQGLIQSGGLAQMAPINGVDLIRLNLDSVKTDMPSTLRLNQNFKDIVVISKNSTQIIGRINGIDIMNDVIHLKPNGKSAQVITGAKLFSHLVLNDNAIIDGLVNGFSLKEIEKNTLFIVNDQRINGHKIVRELIVFSGDNNFVGTLNGLRIPEDLTPLNSNQTIFGHILFKSPIFVNKDLLVTGLVSGHNLSRLASDHLLKDKHQVLTQPMQFDAIVFRQDVTVDQHVNNIDLSSLSNTVKQFTNSVNITKDMLVSKANRHHYISDYLFHTLKNSVFEIDSFSLYQSLDEVHGNHIEVLTDGIFIISESTETPKTVQSIRFDPKTELFDVSYVKDNPFVVRNPFVLKEEEFVVYLSPFAYNFSAQIVKSGQSVATIGNFITSTDVLKISDNRVILVSFQSNSGKLLIHSFEVFPKNKFVFLMVTEKDVGTDTSKVTAFLNFNQVHIVVAKQVGLNCIYNPTGTLILVLRNHASLETIQSLPVMNARDAIHFDNNGKHYLALSDDTSVETSLSRQTIYVYRSDRLRAECSFSLFQKLYFDNAIQLSAFTFGTMYSQNQYLLAANASQVSVWKQKGESGFVDNWVLHTKSARVISPLILNKDLYLIVGQKYKCHESLIFKAQNRGIPLTPIVFRSKYS